MTPEATHFAATDLESRIQAFGHEIFARIRDADTADGTGSTIDQWLMKWVMRDESVKGQLFRFVDVLPALREPSQVSRHLQEYLQTIRDRLPAPLRTAADWLPTHGWLSTIVARAADANVRRMARRFIAAADLDHAVGAIARLRSNRLAFTVDLLGEAVVSESEAEQYQRQYLTLVRDLPPRVSQLSAVPLIDQGALGPLPRANFSIKLSSLYSQFDPIDPVGTQQIVLARLRPILRHAREMGAFINLDMEQYAFKDLTLEIFKSVLQEDEFRDWPDVGIAIQAYLRSTLLDLEGLTAWAARRGTPVWIRLVKGAYWDFESIIAAQNAWSLPVFSDKTQTDANFESAADFLLEHRAHLRCAFASHNVRSLAAVMAMAEHRDADPAEIEFQMLYGMADPIKAALVSMGRRVRVYLPLGKILPGMAYLVRRLLENTSNESFLRAGFIEHVPEEQLLMKPMNVPKPTTLRNSTAEKSTGFVNDSPSDFSIESVRQSVAGAVQKILHLPPRQQQIFVGGKKMPADRWMESLNPSHKSSVIGRWSCANPQQAEQAIAVAKSALDGWGETSIEERAQLLERVAEILKRDRFSIAATEVVECGKGWREADLDVTEAIDFCRYYAWQMRILESPTDIDLPGERNQWTYLPRGVAVVIAPWNFPLAILCGMTAAAVVAGNPVIMKPAEQSSLVAAHLMEAFTEADTPPGVVNYLPGIGEEIGPVLVRHPDVAIIAFTGSRKVGLSINAEASKTSDQQDHVKRVITEMGGKNAIIVDEDADLDEAINGVVASAFGYSGQKCSACSRAIVLAGIYDVFLSRLVQATASLKIAPAEDPACRVGPVIDGEAFSRIHAAIEQGKTQARLAYAGDAGELKKEGFYIAPHIFSEVPTNSQLAQEEIFGPVLSVMNADDLAHALSIANGVKYALTGGVYSRSPANIDRCRRQFRVGNLYINRKITGALVGRQPFGGFKLSGGGTQAGGPDYLRHFMFPRCITENTLRHGFAPVD